jgi:hypothetical protein
MRLKDLFAPVDGEFQIEEALAHWRWLVAEPLTPLAVTAFGDLFAVTQRGTVLRLDTIAGTCDEIADSVDTWKQKLRVPEQLDEWFMPALLIALHEADVYLTQGKCYSADQAIVLGGTFTTDNWKPTHWQVHFAYTGRLHEQLNDLPPGTPITNIKYDPV